MRDSRARLLDTLDAVERIERYTARGRLPVTRIGTMILPRRWNACSTAAWT